MLACCTWPYLNLTMPLMANANSLAALHCLNERSMYLLWCCRVMVTLATTHSICTSGFVLEKVEAIQAFSFAACG